MRKQTPLAALLLTLAATPSAFGSQGIPVWQSGFENGFPGEWTSYDDGSFSSTGSVNSGHNEAWTIVSDIVYKGNYAYKGWPTAAQDDVHRAYPVLHTDVPTPAVNSFMVYLDVDYDQLTNMDWIHLATWANNEDWNVHTMSLLNRRLEMAHLDWEYIGPSPQPEFPLRKWVRFTAYIHYDGGEGYLRVWQDGVPVLEGVYTKRAGTNLMRAHWGWYSNGKVEHGSQYNDEIQVWRLDAPLTDLETEPTSPYGEVDVPVVPDPVDPVEPTEPTEPPAATDPVDPAEPTDPVDPAEPTDPVDPIEPTEPTEPTSSVSEEPSSDQTGVDEPIAEEPAAVDPDSAHPADDVNAEEPVVDDIDVVDGEDSSWIDMGESPFSDPAVISGFDYPTDSMGSTVGELPSDGASCALSATSTSSGGMAWLMLSGLVVGAVRRRRAARK